MKVPGKFDDMAAFPGDNGRIILKKRVKIEDEEMEKIVKKKVQIEEHKAYPMAIRKIYNSG